jgi:hypothetical protein
VALSVKLALSEPPRPLAGMLPYGDRTFLPPKSDFSGPGERLSVRQARLPLWTAGVVKCKSIFFRNVKVV